MPNRDNFRRLRPGDRACRDCGTDLAGRGLSALRCRPCNREVRKARGRRLKADRIRSGLCPWCGEPRSRFSRLCPTCRRRQIARLRERREADREADREGSRSCPDCGIPIRGRAVRCGGCSAARTARKARGQREERKAAGLCRCGRKTAPGRKSCRRCLRSVRTRVSARKAAGLCRCGRPPAPGRKQCPSCLASGRLASARRRVEKRARADAEKRADKGTEGEGGGPTRNGRKPGPPRGRERCPERTGRAEAVLPVSGRKNGGGR